MRTRGAAALGLLLGAVLALTASPVRAQARAGSPIAYLLSAQNRDGGFGSGRGQPSTSLYSAWAALALAAAGRNPGQGAHGGPSVLAYLEANVTSDAGTLERDILVAGASGVSPSNFGGHDLVAALQGLVRPDGSFGEAVYLTNFGVIALRAAGVTVPSRTLHWLERQQDSGGGFPWKTRGIPADVDDTGATLEALRGADPAVSRRAVAFLERQEQRGGGLPSEPGENPNAQSTAWAVQGMVAAGVPAARLARPLGFLRSLITRSGAIDYSRGLSLTPVWVTAEVIPALAGKPFPLTG